MDSDFAQHRMRMVDNQLRTTDVNQPSLLEAMLAVPREDFVAATKRNLAYIDEDLEMVPAAEVRPTRYLIAPSPFAKLVQLAEVGPDETVLDIGCGTGYSAAVLSRMAKSVVALESDTALAAAARENLSRLGAVNVEVVQGELRSGYAPQGPYDVILIGGSIEFFDDVLFAQLREGGRLVAVEGKGNAGKARIYTKWNGVVTGRNAFNVAIMPLPGFERAYTFQF
jgi:protein-L-isoaspartate(D-aspartate) O-methyltransferase